MNGILGRKKSGIATSFVKNTSAVAFSVKVAGTDILL